VNYSNQYYKSARYSLNRKRQIIDAIVNNLHNTQMEMIDEAVDRSDLREAKDVIDYIRAL
jgi:hypothetical protein